VAAVTEPLPLVRQGAQALLEGRFSECERLALEAQRLEPADRDAALLAVAACREQGRPAEAEILVRGFLAGHPGDAEGRALLGAVLADLGRDAEARRLLDLIDHRALPPSVAALGAEVAAALDSPDHAEALHPSLAGHGGAFAGWHGSTFRHLGLVCHVLGRWDEAEASFQAALAANEAAGAPVLVAHTRRHYSALLRARGEDGDWERAIELLTQAASIYRRLEIQRLAEEAELVLRRSQELAPPDHGAGAPNVLRRTPAGWELGFRGQRATVPDAPGMRHLAAVLAADGRPVHALDLVGSGAGAALGDQVAAEYERRLAQLEDHLATATPLAAALARAERDVLAAELGVLAADAAVADEGERARRLVALRIRSAFDDMEDVLPALARHLRRSVRTGIFCLYDPEQPERWSLHW
jgi:tetratricopeptide (TPR) repeat protein